MRKAYTIRAALIPVLTLLFATAYAQVVVNPATGRGYEWVEVPGGISWTDAEAAADVRISPTGVSGNLATITDDAERTFVFSMLTGSGPGKIWIGLSQAACVAPETEPDCGWTWVTGELFDYQNWGPGEPDDVSAGNVVALNLANSTWSDEIDSAADNRGYLVEYGSGTVLASTCQNAFCNPSGHRSTNIVGNTQVGANDTISGHLVEFADYEDDICTGPWAMRDPRVEDDGRPTPGMQVPLDVGPLTTGEIAAGELWFDEKTFGSPCFAVEIAETTIPFFIGAVESRQNPIGIPGIGPVTQCFDMEFPGDPQLASEHLYQDGLVSNMKELAAAALTSSCNSPSLAVIGRFSFNCLNCRQDFGNADINTTVQDLKDELILKLDFLEQTILEAAASFDGNIVTLRRTLDRARSLVKNDKFQKALGHIEELIALNDAASPDPDDPDYPANPGGWDPNDASNPGGQTASRAYNARYRLQQLIALTGP